jgi:hypothetical protein
MNCKQVRKDHRYPAFRKRARAHMEGCASCYAAYQPYFSNAHNLVVDALDRAVEAANQFRERSKRVGKAFGQPKLNDAPHHIALVMCRQVLDECQTYYRKRPDDTVEALCWLQKAFVLCRFFESQDRIEKKGPRKPPLRVGEMDVPPQAAITTPMKFSAATRLSRLPESSKVYGLPVMNPVLEKHITEEMKAGRFVQAVTLICDSPKHGVLSPLQHLAANASPEWVYTVGLSAIATALNTFQREAPEPESTDRPRRPR